MARLPDTPWPSLLPAGVFPGRQAEEGHQLLRILEPCHIPNFADQSHGDDQGHPPKDLKRFPPGAKKPRR